jgi:hypothetical protein
MRRAAVYIPTPGGPVRVENLTRRNALPRSMVRERDAMADLRDLTNSYQNFVEYLAGTDHAVAPWFGDRPAGETATAPYKFELRLSDAIETGGSWRLGALLAHGFAARGELARDAPEDDAEDEATEVIWCTGDVGGSLAVQPVTHVQEKLAASLDALTDWLERACPVTLVLPDNCRDILDTGSVPYGAQILFVDHVDDALSALGLIARSKAVTRSGSAATVAKPRYATRLIATAVIVAVVVAGGATTEIGQSLIRTLLPTDPDLIAEPKPAVDPPGPTQDTAAPVESEQDIAAPPAPEGDDAVPVELEQSDPDSATDIPAVNVRVFERRPPAGQTCAAVHMGAMAAIETEIRVNGNVAARSLGRNLCGLRFIIEPGETDSAPTFLVSMAIKEGTVLRKDQKNIPRNFPFTGRYQWQIDLPRHLRTPLAYEISITPPTAGTAGDGARDFDAIKLSHEVLP